MNKNPIGILDSGVGGLTVWKEIVALLPDESTIYIGDSLNSPYGSKTEEEIYVLSKRLVAFLLEQEVKLIVIACNTITVTCLDRLRKEFPQVPLIGTVPVVKKAVELTKNKRIGILSTTRTATSSYQKEWIAKFADGYVILNLGTDRLVPVVEKGDTWESGEMREVLEEVLQPLREADIDTLVLGCTHFPFLRKDIQKILGENMLLLDSGAAIARQVKRVLEANNIVTDEKKAAHTFLTTGMKEQFAKVLNGLVGERQDATIQAVTL